MDVIEIVGKDDKEGAATGGDAGEAEQLKRLRDDLAAALSRPTDDVMVQVTTDPPGKKSLYLKSPGTWQSKDNQLNLTLIKDEYSMTSLATDLALKWKSGATPSFINMFSLDDVITQQMRLHEKLKLSGNWLNVVTYTHSNEQYKAYVFVDGEPATENETIALQKLLDTKVDFLEGNEFGAPQTIDGFEFTHDQNPLIDGNKITKVATPIGGGGAAAATGTSSAFIDHGAGGHVLSRTAVVARGPPQRQ